MRQADPQREPCSPSVREPTKATLPMRLNVPRMLYSPERSSLAGTAPTGSVLHETIFPAGVHSGKRHTLFGVKDGNGSSMGRGYKSIGKLSAFFLRTLPLLLLCCIAVLDPIKQTAQQEIDQIQQQLSTQPSGGPPAPNEQMSRQNEALASIGSLSGPVELKPISNDPITLHMVEDVKVIYQAIGKATGINVLFDPDYTSKRIPVDLNNVSWSDALRIVGSLAGTFYKPVTSNTIFVAQNTRTKRTDLDEQE